MNSNIASRGPCDSRVEKPSGMTSPEYDYRSSAKLGERMFSA